LPKVGQVKSRLLGVYLYPHVCVVYFLLLKKMLVLR